MHPFASWQTYGTGVRQSAVSAAGPTDARIFFVSMRAGSWFPHFVF